MLVLTLTAVSRTSLFMLQRNEWVTVSNEYIVFYIFWLRTVTESTWKILKFDRKTLVIFFFQNNGNPVLHVYDEKLTTEQLSSSVILFSVVFVMFFPRRAAGRLRSNLAVSWRRSFDEELRQPDSGRSRYHCQQQSYCRLDQWLQGI